MHLSAVDRLFWATGFLGQMILLVVLFSRGRAKQFPFFTILAADSFLKTGVMYFVYHYASQRTYYYTYWITGAENMLLQLGLVYEIASHLFAPLGRWASDVRASFIRLIGISVLIDIALTALASPARIGTFETVVTRGTFFSSTLMTELFVGLVVVSATAGFPWRTHVARIAQGQGAYCLVGVLYDTTTSWMSWAHQASTIRALAEMKVGAYLAALGFWIVTLWQEAPEPRRLSEPMRGQ